MPLLAVDVASATARLAYRLREIRHVDAAVVRVLSRRRCAMRSACPVVFTVLREREVPVDAMQTG